MKKLKKPGNLFRNTRSPVVTMKPQRSSKRPPWLLFFYSVPSKPVSNRMRVWRRLIKAGAVNLKGAVYILPFNDDRYEFLQWLVSEIVAMKGEAAIARIEKIDTMKHSEIVALFDAQRANDYRTAERTFDDLERRLSNIQKGAKAQNVKGISVQFARILKDFEEIKQIDFFSSKEGERLTGKVKRLKAGLKALPGVEPGKEKFIAITPRKLDDYEGKIWMTRKRPFIDRMASAWLIKRFIDKNAVFRFVDESNIEAASKNSVAFDVRGGEFTHAGEMCTFEVLMKCFGLKDTILRKMAEVVHELDVKDDKYRNPEATGIGEILSGLRKAVRDDAELLEKGILVFEMLYRSKAG